VVVIEVKCGCGDDPGWIEAQPNGGPMILHVYPGNTYHKQRGLRKAGPRAKGGEVILDCPLLVRHCPNQEYTIRSSSTKPRGERFNA